MAEAALLAPYPLSKQRRPRPRIGGPPRERTRKVPLLGWLRAVREGSDLGQSPVDLEGDGGEEVVHAAIAGEARPGRGLDRRGADRVDPDVAALQFLEPGADQAAGEEPGGDGQPDAAGSPLMTATRRSRTPDMLPAFRAAAWLPSAPDVAAGGYGAPVPTWPEHGGITAVGHD